jgi:hypothetical protein
MTADLDMTTSLAPRFVELIDQKVYQEKCIIYAGPQFQEKLHRSQIRSVSAASVFCLRKDIQRLKKKLNTNSTPFALSISALGKSE